MTKLALQIDGLKQYQKSLRRLDSDLPKALRVALNGCADFLIDKTRPQIPKRSGKAAGSLTARSTRTAVRIAVGGRAAPYYPWLDFGGAVGRDNSVVRPFYKEGRYLYPTLRKNSDEFAKITRGALVAVGRDAGIDID